jgi:phage gp16-like protein
VSAAPAKKAKTGAQLVAHEIKLIQIGRTALGLDEDTYRQMLSTLCGGKSSSKQLTWQERKKVLDHMKACGFQLRTRAPAAPTLGRVELQMDKLRKMWHELALRGAVETLDDLQGVDAAIEAWAKRMLKDRFPGGMRLVTGAQMTQLVEAMKKWLTRVGGDLRDYRIADPLRKDD